MEETDVSMNLLSSPRDQARNSYTGIPYGRARPMKIGRHPFTSLVASHIYHSHCRCNIKGDGKLYKLKYKIRKYTRPVSVSDDLSRPIVLFYQTKISFDLPLLPCDDLSHTV